MLRRVFCKLLFIVAVVLWAFSGILLAQSRSEEGLERAIAAQEKHTERLMEILDVEGTAVGLDENDQFVVKVFTSRPGVAGIPLTLEGVPVQVEVTGKFVARTTGRYRPAPIGVSTGHPDITAGTIGCRVIDGTGNVYALSNNHVYANSNNASIGDSALQPGPYDKGTDPADKIGTLYDYEPIVFTRTARNKMDAAIALSSLDMLDNATLSGGYGTPNSDIVDAFVGQDVQKFGRTTKLTRGQVTYINATVNVSYGPSKTARFVEQIVIAPGSFSAGGDSGSLIVTDDNSINPVGLLFAGSTDYTIANPIGAVLVRFGVTVDDSSGSTPPEYGYISGKVTDAETSSAISGATVSVNGTSLSATTSSDGNYTISDVPVGTYSVTASATGFQSKTTSGVVVLNDQSTTVDFSLSKVISANNVYVILPNGIEGYATSGGKDGKKHLSVTVALVDNLGNPVAGASVSVSLNNTTTDVSWKATGTTGTSGKVTFTLNNAPSGTYKTTVTNVSAAGLEWDGVTPPNDFEK